MSSGDDLTHLRGDLLRPRLFLTMTKSIMLAASLLCGACEIQSAAPDLTVRDAGPDASPAPATAEVEGCIRLDDPSECVGASAWTCIGDLPRVVGPVVPCDVPARQPWADSGVTVMCCGSPAVIDAPSAGHTPAKI